MSIPRNRIEFRDSSPDSAGHFTSTILIDGSEVAVERDSVRLETLAPDATKVTLTLLPHRVAFN